MNSNAVGSLIYAIVAIVVAIISATAMRFKAYNWDRFDIGDAFLGMLLGILWPLTIVAGIVYLASDFLYRKIKAKKGN
jgi:chromate transport protein ChrA